VPFFAAPSNGFFAIAKAKSRLRCSSSGRISGK
jgi:hypothetical protein